MIIASIHLHLNIFTGNVLSEPYKKEKHQRTILIHSADDDLLKSLTALLQENYVIIRTKTVSEFILHRENSSLSLLIVDLEKSIPELLQEFHKRLELHIRQPLIVLYAFRVNKPLWEKALRSLASQILYKPVQIELILNAIDKEEDSIIGLR